MPIFMLISGYLFYFSLKRHESKKIVKSKIERCLIPIFICNIIYELIRALVCRSNLNLLMAVNNGFNSLSFLWAVFYSSIIILVVNKLYNDKIYAYIIVIVLSLIVDSRYLNFALYLLPFFITGYLFNKYKDKFKKFIDSKIIYIIIVLFLIIYLILLNYFDFSKYIYNSSYSILYNFVNLYTNIYRFAIGIVGSILLILIVKKLLFILDKIRIFEYLGKNSLSIYTISYFVQNVFTYYSSNLTFSYINIIVQTVLMLIITNIITIVLRKFKVTKKYLLGE